MQKHTNAFIPLRSWSYSSPDLLDAGRKVDVGLLAEGLLYYESVTIEITDGLQMHELIGWFHEQERIPDLLGMIHDGTIRFYGYNFIIQEFGTAVNNLPSFSMTNARTSAGGVNHVSFAANYVNTPLFFELIRDGYQRESLQSLLQEKFIVAKAEDYDSSLANAQNDFLDPARCSLIINAFIEEVCQIKGIKHIPKIEVSLGPVAGIGMIGIGNFGPARPIILSGDMDTVKSLCGKNIPFRLPIAMVAEGNCTRIIKSAAQLECDLYLGRPMSRLVGDKLYESSRSIKISDIIGDLEAQVEFPDVRRLVNEGHLNLTHILDWRKAAKKFRNWLQDESDRDRDSIIAYHNEIGKQLGHGQKLLSLFGVLGKGSIAYAAHHNIIGPVGTVVASKALDYLSETGRSMLVWKPVVFGNWFRAKIEKVMEERK